MKFVPHKSWKSLLENNDAALLWQSLHHLVSIHPLVRSAQRNQHNPKNVTSLLSLPDLTQDLYLLLLEKSRFSHYAQAHMTDAEIEREIFQYRYRYLKPSSKQLLFLHPSPEIKLFETG